MSPPRATWRLERVLWARGHRLIAGTDEVGLGCLAGPVVAAAVILTPGRGPKQLRDSKTLSAPQRERLVEDIRRRAVAWSIGVASVEEIATLNIYRAGIAAMQRAVAALTVPPDAVLSDARTLPGLSCHHEAIVHGDQRVASIAAASIIAKVYRDALMRILDAQFPGYGLARHKGYATRTHLDALRALGPSPVHRSTFAPVRMFSALRAHPTG